MAKRKRSTAVADPGPYEGLQGINVLLNIVIDYAVPADYARTMAYAYAHDGKLDMIQWIDRKWGIVQMHQLVMNACLSGELAVVEWCFTIPAYRFVQFNRDEIRLFSLSTVDRLIRKHGVCDVGLYGAALMGDLEYVRQMDPYRSLLTRRDFKFDILYAAWTNGQLAVAQHEVDAWSALGCDAELSAYADQSFFSVQQIRHLTVVRCACQLTGPVRRTRQHIQTYVDELQAIDDDFMLRHRTEMIRYLTDTNNGPPQLRE